MNLARIETNGCRWLRGATGILGTTRLASDVVPIVHHKSPGLRATTHGVLSVADQSGSASARDVWQFGIGSGERPSALAHTAGIGGHQRVPIQSGHGKWCG